MNQVFRRQARYVEVQRVQRDALDVHREFSTSSLYKAFAYLGLIR